MLNKIVTDRNKIEKIFNRYIDTVYPSREKALEFMAAGKPLTFYLGIDPTGPDIHFGHVTNLLVLKNIINLGHRVILLIGDFTAQTGDPTDKNATRKSLSTDDVKKNMETYLEQVEKILKKETFEVEYNSQWHNKMTFNDLRLIARQFTVQQLIAREMFQARIKEEKGITIEEFLYPLMQGYDSVAMKVDGEIGGTDQTFNMLIGRDLVASLLKKEKIVLTTKLLEDPATGKKLMNKSEGHLISIKDSPGEMFGKIMAMPDTAILPLFILTTEVEDQKIIEIEERLSKDENPRDLKLELAAELVGMYYGEENAKKNQQNFQKVFSKGELPLDIEKFEIKGQSQAIIEILISWLEISASSAKRLVEQGAVSVNDKLVNKWDQIIEKGDVIKSGPRRFVKTQ